MHAGGGLDNVVEAVTALPVNPSGSCSSPCGTRLGYGPCGVPHFQAPQPHDTLLATGCG